MPRKIHAEAEDSHVFQVYLKALHEISIELTQIETLDNFYKRVVELGRSRLGFDRLALFLSNSEQATATGTYGTDEQGNLTDERHFHFTPNPIGNMIKALNFVERFSLEEDVELRTQFEVSGQGWNAASVLRNGNECLGWLLTDNAIHHQPVSKVLMEILALYSMSVGSILAQKRTQVALRDSEAQYRFLAENINDLITRTDISGRLLYASPSRHGWEYEPKELIGQLIFDFVHPDDLPHARKRLDQAIEHHYADFSETFRFRRKDGAYSWMENSFRLIWSEDASRVVEIVNVSRDVNARKQAEKALAEERNLLRTLIDAIPHQIYIKNIASQFLITNKTSADGFNQLLSRNDMPAKPISSDEMVEKTDFDYLPHEFAQRMFDEEQKIMRVGGALIDNEFWVNDPIRGVIWYSDTKVPLRDTNGGIIGLVGINRDITDQKRAAAMLVEERTLLRTLIDAIPDYIYVKDTKSRFTLANKALLKDIAAATTETIIGKTDFDLAPVEVAQSYFDVERKVLENEATVISHEEVITTPSGEQRYISSTKVPLHDASGKLIGLVGIGRDITEQKQAELALAEERNLLRSIIDQIPDYVFTKDIDSRFTLINQAASNGFGLTFAELAGKTDFDFLPAELARFYFTQEQEIIRSGAPLIHYEELVNNLVTGPQWLDSTKVPLRNVEGNIVGLVCVVRVIDERKAFEQALADERNILSTIIETMPDYIFAKDAQGRFWFSNQATLRGFGLGSWKAVVGKTDFDYLPYEQAQQYFEEEQRILQGGPPMMNAERLSVTKEFGQIWLSMTKVRLTSVSGQNLGLLCVYHDITERKLAEQALAEHHHLLQSVIDHLPDFVYVKDLQGNYILDNISHARSVGKTPAEMVGRGDSDFFPVEMAEGFLRDDIYVCETGRPLLNHEERSLNVDGQPVWMITNKVPFRDSAGKIIGLIGQTYDITERKLAELILKRERDFSDAVFNSMSALMVVFDTEGRIVRFNHTCEQLTGYKSAEVLGRLFHQLFAPPDEQELRITAFNTLIAEAQPRRYINYWQMRDGSQRLIELQHSHLLDENGKIMYLISSGIDVTERELTQQKLLEQEQRFRSLIEHSADIVTVVDPQGMTIYNSPALTKVLGYDLEAKIGVLALDWVHPEDLERATTMLGDILNNPAQIYRGEFRLQHQNTEYRWFEVKVSNLLSEPGVNGVVINYHDITERKLAEHQAIELAAERARVKILSNFVQGVSHDFRTPLSISNLSVDLIERIEDPERRRQHLEKIRSANSVLETLLQRMLVRYRDYAQTRSQRHQQGCRPGLQRDGESCPT